MDTTFDSITRQAMFLPPDQRLALAKQLLSTIESESEAASCATWHAEIVARIARYDAGQTKTIPASEVFAQLRREFQE